MNQTGSNTRSIAKPNKGKPGGRKFGPTKTGSKWAGVEGRPGFGTGKAPGPRGGPKQYGTQIQPGGKVTPKVPSKGKGKAVGGKSGGSGPRYGAVPGFAGIRPGEALSLVNAQLKPEIRQTQNDIQTVRRETQLERQRANRQYSAAVGDIGHIYGESGDYINYQNDLINQNFQNLSGQTQTAQSALMSHLQGTGAQAQTDANAEIARLGLSDMPYTELMSQDQNFTTDQAAISGANNMANLNLSHQNSSELGNLLLGMNTGSQTAAYGRAANAKSDALFEAQGNKHTAVEQLKRTLKDLRMSRPDLVNQMMEQLLQSRWGQYMDQSQLSLQQEELNLQRSAQRQSHQAQMAQIRSYNKRGSSYTPYGSSGGSGGSATGDGSGAGGTGALDPFNQLVLDQMTGKKPKSPRPPKPGKKR